jgi:hypothetical protein
LNIDEEMISDPFSTWREGIALDEAGQFQDASSKFKLAAGEFFDLASRTPKTERAAYEYSTLMDAYSRIERGREHFLNLDFDNSLDEFNSSTEILRATVHFGYLAPYLSACASAETADSMPRGDPECLQAYKNAIALFEQSKLALSFRDESHPSMKIMDAYIKYCISRALFVESLDCKLKGDIGLSEEKEKRSSSIMVEFQDLATKARIPALGFKYLIANDYERASQGAFVITYPDATALTALNIGKNEARIISIGDFSMEKSDLLPGESMYIDSNNFDKGKIRVCYIDLTTGKEYDEGCLLRI